MKSITNHITLDREECLTCSAQEIISKLENWVNERFDNDSFYSYFRWEVDCHFMAASALDNVGRIVFIVELD